MPIKPLNASRIVDIPLNTWKDVGNNASNVVRDQIRKRRIIKGDYSPSYATAKRNRKAARSQSSTETGFVDLTLTGKMLDNLKVRKVSSDGVTIGFIGTYAKRVQDLQSRGFKKGADWFVFNNDVTNQIALDTVKRIDKQLNMNIKVATKQPITFTIGK